MVLIAGILGKFAATLVGKVVLGGTVVGAVSGLFMLAKCSYDQSKIDEGRLLERGDIREKTKDAQRRGRERGKATRRRVEETLKKANTEKDPFKRSKERLKAITGG